VPKLFKIRCRINRIRVTELLQIACRNCPDYAK
jgi:hypothetical protein